MSLERFKINSCIIRFIEVTEKWSILLAGSRMFQFISFLNSDFDHSQTCLTSLDHICVYKIWSRCCSLRIKCSEEKVYYYSSHDTKIETGWEIEYAACKKSRNKLQMKLVMSWIKEIRCEHIGELNYKNCEKVCSKQLWL